MCFGERENHFIFKNKKTLLPVIHVVNEEDTLYNINLINKYNIEGCFLISHGDLDYNELIKLGTKIKNDNPNLWIGYNFLDIEEEKIFNTLKELKFFPDGIWLDNSFVGLKGCNDIVEQMNRDLFFYRTSGFNGLYFGGFAFKYQRQPESLEKATREAVSKLNVITTSGTGTGKSADIDKIKTIYKNSIMLDAVIGKEVFKPIGIASGITVDNVKDYLPFVDNFLVATGISKTDTLFDEDKLKILNEIISSYK